MASRGAVISLQHRARPLQSVQGAVASSARQWSCLPMTVYLSVRRQAPALSRITLCRNFFDKIRLFILTFYF